MKRRFCILGIVAIIAAAAVPIASAQQLVLKSYTRAHGLASDYVMCMFQDRTGFMWFGTDRGVSRYDGHEFVTFTTNDGLGSNFVYAIFHDANGAMWFGTYEGGVSRYDGRSLTTWNAASGFPLSTVYSIAQDRDGRMYFSSGGSLAWMLDDRVGMLAAPSPIYRVFELPNGRVAIQSNTEIYEIAVHGDSTVQYRSISGLPRGTSFDKAIAVTANGNLLLSTNGVVNRFSQIDSSWRKDLEHTIGTSAYSVAEGKSGSFWVGTAGKGIFHVLDDRVVNYTTRHGIAKDRIESLLADYEGNIWIGTFGGGVQLLISADIEIYNREDGLPGNDVTKVFLDSKRRLWAGTERGIAVIEDDEIIEIPTIREARGFAEDSKGRMYIGNLQSLFGPSTLSDLRRGAVVPARQIGHGVSGLSVRGASVETLWVGTYGNGVQRFIENTTQTFRVGDGLMSDMSEEVVIGSRGVWFLSRSSGASEFRDGKFQTFSRSQGLPSNAIHCVLENGDGIWFGTGKGVVHLARDGSTIREIKGLKGSNAFSIFKTKRHTNQSPSLWILTDEALHRYENNALEVFGSLTGSLLQNVRVNNACFNDSTETLWLATTGGVAKIQLGKIEKVQREPRVVITDVHVDSGRIDAPFISEISSPLRFNHSQNNILIGYAGLSFANEHSVRYMVKLDGLDAEWSKPTREKHLQYRGLPPGSYTFSVVAVNADGVKSSKPVRFAFEVLPPFWNTWWFRLIAGFGAIVAFGGIVRYVSQRRLRTHIQRLERDRAVQHERERISRDLHDHVGALLVNIISGLDLVSKYSPPADKRTERLLRSLQQDARSSMLQLRETIWAIKGQGMDVEKFVEQVERYARRQVEFFDHVDLTVDARCAAGFELTPIQVLNSFRIVQEALSNCAKHAKAENIWLEIHTDSTAGITIRVRDDGIGVRHSANSELSGNGVFNMKKRAEEIGGTVGVNQVNGRGTEVVLNVPPTRS